MAVCPSIVLGAGKSAKGAPEREKAAVTRLEQEWVTALNTADVKTIGEVLADDFVRPAPQASQFITRAHLLSYYRKHLSSHDPNQRRISDMKVSVYGTTAIARGVVTTTDAQGRTIRQLLFTDVFVKRNGKWKAVSAQENQVPAAAK